MNKTNKSLLDIVDRFKNKKIAVWGDFILDEYIFGNTNRISREAPVLILTFKNRKFYLGGAGNSVLNLHALGANPLPIGIYGPDEPGNKIVEFMKEKGIKAKYLFCEKNYRTPIKTRILAGEETARKQQILRIDQEQTVPDKKEIKKKMEDSLIFMKDKIDALLIS
ncbi:MAG: bifunctional heptose 7-phosphate kinase/heptose 1-phosphate adenyltransferase, partial [Candidatus Aminicenantaceae bacterium]